MTTTMTFKIFQTFHHHWPNKSLKNHWSRMKVINNSPIHMHVRVMECLRVFVRLSEMKEKERRKKSSEKFFPFQGNGHVWCYDYRAKENKCITFYWTQRAAMRWKHVFTPKNTLKVSLKSAQYPKRKHMEIWSTTKKGVIMCEIRWWSSWFNDFSFFNKWGWKSDDFRYLRLAFAPCLHQIFPFRFRS